MPAQQNQSHFDHLRKKFAYFDFCGFQVLHIDDSIVISFDFDLSGQYRFKPTLSIPSKPFITKEIDPQFLNNLAFQIGMVELVSYWKAACPQRVIISAGYLDDFQIKWWKNLYFNGLGEFFYLNGIQPDFEDFMQIEINSTHKFEPVSIITHQNIVVPVGGGKDSTVTLDLMKASGKRLIPFIINPRKATLETAMAAGFSPDQIFIIQRTIDPLLIDLNQQGFLNGHTPFSALLAFTSFLAAYMTQSMYIALSNESSANEPTIPGTNINHQYSKSIDFERDFREYSGKYLSVNIEYFSLLRPLNELQIAKIFSALKHQHPHFKSCNAGSKTDLWCGKCSKCLFTWIILSPFFEENDLEAVFGNNLFNDNTLQPIFDQLTGIADEKPFECVGTVDEVNVALHLVINRLDRDELPVLLDYYRRSAKFGFYLETIRQQHLKAFNPNHFVPPQFEKLLREAVG